MEDLYQQFIGIVIVLGALISMLWYARKRGFARLNIGTAGPNRLLKVVERVPLTSQHTLFLVSVGDRTMVLSSSPGSCQVVTELNAEAKR
jgi:flagellar biogenesis protein FliO